MVYPDCPCTDSDSKTDTKETKQKERRRGRSMRTTRMTKNSHGYIPVHDILSGCSKTSTGS